MQTCSRYLLHRQHFLADNLTGQMFTDRESPRASTRFFDAPITPIPLSCVFLLSCFILLPISLALSQAQANYFSTPGSFPGYPPPRPQAQMVGPRRWLNSRDSRGSPSSGQCRRLLASWLTGQPFPAISL